MSEPSSGSGIRIWIKFAHAQFLTVHCAIFICFHKISDYTKALVRMFFIFIFTLSHLTMLFQLFLYCLHLTKLFFLNTTYTCTCSSIKFTIIVHAECYRPLIIVSVRQIHIVANYYVSSSSIFIVLNFLSLSWCSL